MEVNITALTKVYGNGTVALKNVNLSFGRGMVGLLGPNGAGKTTLMRILATLLTPTSGIALIAGHRTDNAIGRRRIREQLGYVPQELTLYGDLTAHEFLTFVALLKQVPPKKRKQQVAELLETVGLRERAGQRLKTFSSGMKRRIGIAQALLGNPQFLIVDEPTAGLDPEERIRFRNLLVDLAGARTILLSTHLLEDIQSTCQRVAVLARGHLVFDGTLETMLQTVSGSVWELMLEAGERVPVSAKQVSMRPDGTGFRVRVLAASKPHPNAVAIPPSLEDAYLALLATIPKSL